MSNEVTKSTSLSFDVYWLGFIKTCLRPLIRILIKQKVEFNSFQNLVRGLFVEEAEKYILETSENSRGKISSIAYQTGLDRREVSRILKGQASEIEWVEQNRSRESNILDHWYSHPPFCTTKGKPVPLKRSGKGLSFETLTQKFGKNISHGPILEALLESNCVEIMDGKVHLINRSFTPQSAANPTKIEVAANSIKRLTTTIAHNFEHQEDANFQRNLFSIKIPNENKAQFRAEITEMMRHHYHNTFIPEFEAIERNYESITVPKNTTRIGFGFFYFDEQL
ncbi:DUF6502 family protein [Marinicella sediminis]|uniref:DUF6502 family protein n=1 Tax=Marinicella sediminis TaxID=1792834 RepID=A0ABV7J8I7_9GAMM|nr:DUF6502 family protein [Marinicella sediminis]